MGEEKKTAQKIVSFKFEIKLEDELSVLAAKSDLPVFFFQTRECSKQFLGFDIAWKYGKKKLSESVFEAEQLCEQNNDLVFFSAIPFDFVALNNEWKSFEAFGVVLPFIMFTKIDGSTFLQINYMSDTTPVELLTKVTKILIAIFGNETKNENKPQSVEFFKQLPTKEKWEDSVNEVLKKIDDKWCKKTVLARKEVFTHDCNGRMLIGQELKSLNINRSYVVYFSPDKSHGFLSLSPERLFKLSKKSIEIDSLAGSRPASNIKDVDHHMREELKNSQKDLNEHREVSTYIEGCLKDLTSSFKKTVSEEIIDLSYIHHIYSAYQGVVKDDVLIWDIISMLHPTPAIGGFPKENAINLISLHEPFERGLFAAPLGILSKHHTEFVVGIRSALVDEQHLHLYAGAGIVSGSDSKSEWEETSVKMGKLARILCK